MIRVVSRGNYRLVETKDFTKVFLFSNRQAFTWLPAQGMIEMYYEKNPSLMSTLARGTYYIYETKNENDPPILQLEVYIGKRAWQGYMLPAGLPTMKEMRKRIIPTKDVITKSYV